MALVAKILETTLTAGQTTVSFNDSDIPNSLIRVYTTNPDLFPIQQSLSGNVLTVAFEKQSSNIGVALEIVKQGLTVADNLTTESSEQALSAKQGKVLKSLIDGIVIPTVPENITDLNDVAVSDIQDGQVLAWDSVTEKFKNVDQSGGVGYPVIDYTNHIATANSSLFRETLTYTATVKCMAFIVYSGSGGTNMYPVVNGKHLSGIGTLSNRTLCYMFLLNPGDTIGKRVDNNNESCYFKYTIYACT